MSAPAAPAQSGSQANPIWVWRPVANDKETLLVHPSDIPVDDEALSNAYFVDHIRGPKLAKITPATLLQMKGNLALIAENGATREVPKTCVLPWYEGLLLLEEMESMSSVSWTDEKLNALLEVERNKCQKKQLSSALYTEKRLISTAVTGMRYVDAEGKEWLYRRENVSNNDKADVPDGKDEGGLFRIREIVGYLPPWEAFCNERCGFYQDFYEVVWDYPFSEIDYSQVENGSTNRKGATWEPDECLPPQLDNMRLAAKRAWIKARREKELLRDDKARVVQARVVQAVANKPAEEASKLTIPDPEQPLAKKAKTRRDGTALERDMMRSVQGHDFAPTADMEKTFGGIRSSWPKHPQDYPKGYGVADPPGFCFEGCDCMDDQRPQHAWETQKAWLEDPSRSTSALRCIETLAQQTEFVRKRGVVSKMFYFETLLSNAQTPRAAHSRSAVDLAAAIEKSLRVVIKTIPISALLNRSAPVRVPGKIFLKPDLDYELLRFHAKSVGGGPPPSWLHCDMDDGTLSAKEPIPNPLEHFEFRVSLVASEGTVAEAECGVTSEQLRGSTSPWAKATVAIVRLFGDAGLSRLEKGYMDVLWLHLAEVYDFSTRSIRDVPLGEWLDVVYRILGMLRACAVANVTLGTSHRGSSGV